MNEIIEYLSQRSIDVLPPNMKQVLGHLILADCSHRAFMSKQELAYRVMGLPPVRRSFADVHVVGFYHRANLIQKMEENERTIVYSDRTEYSAYAERCRESTVIWNRKNACEDKKLTVEEIQNMNFREFAETINHVWIKKAHEAAEEIGPGTTRKFMTRDVNSGHWVLKRRLKRGHIRFSTNLYTEPAHLYEPVIEGETTSRTDFFELKSPERRQLYRAYMELVCYVPWQNTPEETFISDEADRSMLEDSLQVSFILQFLNERVYICKQTHLTNGRTQRFICCHIFKGRSNGSHDPQHLWQAC